MAKRKLHLSASAIGAFLACPMRFKGAYIDGVRKTEQTECLRRGTNWHEILEIADIQVGQACPYCFDSNLNPECPVCQGTGYLAGDSVDAAFRMLNEAYKNVPNGVVVEDWLTERAKLFYSLSAYKWWWGIGEQDQEYEVVATEVPFDMPLINPETGNSCRDVRLVGKIDKVIRFTDGGLFGQMEHKSTAKPIDDDAEYWNHLRMDVQTTLYPYAMLRMQKEGKLEKYGIMPDSPIATKVLYDVWHTPQIKMKKLSFADTKKFVKSGEYMDTTFDITDANIDTVYNVLKSGELSTKGKDVVAYGKDVRVDGHPVKTIKGTKEGDVNFMETEGMYGTRLFKDLTEKPEKYFNRREIQRSVKEMTRFEGQMYSMYQAILMMRRTDGWWPDGTQCEAKFRCQYTPYCWHGEELSPDNLLEGFKCIFSGKDKDGNAKV